MIGETPNRTDADSGALAACRSQARQTNRNMGMSDSTVDELQLAADDFDSAWQTGAPPSVREFFERCSRRQEPWSAEQRERLLVSLIKIDLEYRWRKWKQKRRDQRELHAASTTASTTVDRVDRRLLEPYLEEFSDVALGDSSVLELVTQEFRVRHQSGDRPQVESYLPRFAPLADRIRERLADYDKILAIEASIEHLFNAPEPVSDSSLAERLAVPASPPREPAAASTDLSLAEILAEISPFQDLSPGIQRALADHATERSFRAGEIILRQGEASDCLLIMLEGVAEVTLDDAGETHRIARVGRRTVIGEIGLITREVRSANISAVTDVQAAIISSGDFEKLAGQFPALSVALSELISERVGTLTIDVLCGKTINDFYVKQRLGRGSMGIVYKAIDSGTGTEVALKMLRHDLTFNRQAALRFRQEAEIVKSLTHPNIVRVYGQFAAYQTNFIAMEFCDGLTLADFIKAHGPLPDDVTRAILGQLSAALLYAHRAGVAHRDLKPSNVMLQWDGIVKLTDFGLARDASVSNSSLTGHGQVLGTPRYMAPEQLGGARGDERVDLYALGCLSFELIKGSPLFPARRFDELMRQRFRWTMPTADEIREGLDPDLYDLIANCLADRPDDRNVPLESLCRWARPVDPDLLAAAAAGVNPDRGNDPPSTVVPDE
jgi:eukaryotic-like serine/threonine-protein kinase